MNQKVCSINNTEVTTTKQIAVSIIYTRDIMSTLTVLAITSSHNGGILHTEMGAVHNYIMRLKTSLVHNIIQCAKDYARIRSS